MASQVPFVISVVNKILVVLLLLVPVDTQVSPASCVPEIQVRKNTIYTASSESMLNISCTTKYCKEMPQVVWIKIDDTSNFIRINTNSQITITQEQNGPNSTISFLSFKNISSDDKGIYRCMVSVSSFLIESHSINVSVSESSYANAKNTTGGNAVPGARWLLYVFIGLGILGLVVIVMLISFLCINGYSRKDSNRRHKNVAFCPKPQSATTSGKSQEFPEEQNNIYDAPTDDLYSGEIYLYAGNIQERTPVRRSGNRSGDESQVHTQVVYATLQHPTPREPSAVRQHSREQLSEYVSIRIS